LGASERRAKTIWATTRNDERSTHPTSPPPAGLWPIAARTRMIFEASPIHPISRARRCPICVYVLKAGANGVFMEIARDFVVYGGLNVLAPTSRSR
jgi:hypothetical protein